MGPTIPAKEPLPTRLGYLPPMQRPSGGAPVMMGNLTPFTKLVMGGMLALYILQLVLENVGIPVTRHLALYPLGPGFGPWQLLTHPLLHTSPTDLLFEEIFIFFFLPFIEGMIGRNGVLRLWGLSSILGWVIGTLFTLLGLVGPSPLIGTYVLSTAMVVTYAFAQPNANINLWFVLPIKAIWFAWGSALLIGLSLLAYRGFPMAAAVGGWVGGWAFMQLRLPGGWKRPFLKIKEKQVKRKLHRFEVIEGGQSEQPPEEDDDWIH